MTSPEASTVAGIHEPLGRTWGRETRRRGLAPALTDQANTKYCKPLVRKPSARPILYVIPAAQREDLAAQHWVLLLFQRQCFKSLTLATTLT